MLGPVNALALLAPLFLAFELWQLVMCERYLGIKQIARGSDPREMGPSEPVSFLWTSAIVLYALWTLALLTTPGTRGAAAGLVVTTLVGYPLRRNCGLNRVLIILTFEGSIRIVFVGALMVAAWRRL